MRPRGLVAAALVVIAALLALVVASKPAPAREPATTSSPASGRPRWRLLALVVVVLAVASIGATYAVVSIRSGGGGAGELALVPDASQGDLPTAVVTPASTRPAASAVTPTETRPAASPAVQPRGFVTVCGVSLCLDGQIWYAYSASVNGASNDPAGKVDLAASGGLNMVRLTDWLDVHGDPALAAFDEGRWQKVDAMIAAAGRRGLHVLLDLSCYRNLVSQDGSVNKYTLDYGPFLRWVVNRINTVSGVRYGDDPTIAIFSLAGEVEPLNTPDNTLGISTEDVNEFFRRTAAEFKEYDRNHVLSPGGLYQLGWNSGIDYQTVFAIPDLDVCAVHAPASGGDAKLTADYCAGLGKPWIWEEFSQPQKIGDQARADWFQTVYDRARDWNAAGVSFWNLGTGLGANNSDVGPQTPLTWNTVVVNASRRSAIDSPSP